MLLLAFSVVVFLAFSDENVNKVKSTLNHFPFQYKQIVNAKVFTSKVQSKLVKTYPQNLVVDRNGTVLFDVSDGSTNIYRDLDNLIQSLLTN